jgi:voltage-gated potassium channel Kch
MRVERPPLLWEVERAKGWIRCIDSAARDARITFTYSRTMGEAGSVTAYFPRLSP